MTLRFKYQLRLSTQAQPTETELFLTDLWKCMSSVGILSTLQSWDHIQPFLSKHGPQGHTPKS